MEEEKWKLNINIYDDMKINSVHNSRYYRFPVSQSFQMQSRTLWPRVHAAGATVKHFSYLDKIRHTFLWSNITQCVKFNMHYFWLFTAGQRRSAILSADKSRLNGRFGWVSTTQFTLFTADVSEKNTAFAFKMILFSTGCLTSLDDRGSTVVKVLCYKSDGRWFDSRWYLTGRTAVAQWLRYCARKRKVAGSIPDGT